MFSKSGAGTGPARRHHCMSLCLYLCRPPLFYFSILIKSVSFSFNFFSFGVVCAGPVPATLRIFMFLFWRVGWLAGPAGDPPKLNMEHVDNENDCEMDGFWTNLKDRVLLTGWLVDVPCVFVCVVWLFACRAGRQRLVQRGSPAQKSPWGLAESMTQTPAPISVNTTRR